MHGSPAVDKAVLEALPPGARVLSVEQAGSSDWAITSRVSVSLSDGTTQHYFLKSAMGPVGHMMLQGESVASNLIHAAMPSFIPKPHAWGKLQESSSEAYFFLSDFTFIDHTLPDPDKFTARLAELHRTTTSPNGKFGFSVVTCDGAVPHRVAWRSNWGDFFGELLRGVLEHDATANGKWADLEYIANHIIANVIPRLLGVLQEGGRQLRPALIHGDMYSENFGTNTKTGEIIIWDASSYYAHNEMELGLWRWNEVMQGFTESYLRNFGKSEPEEEWDDRNRLYSVKTKLNMSVDHPGEDGRRMRRSAFDDLRYLCDKYAPLQEFSSLHY